MLVASEELACYWRHSPSRWSGLVQVLLQVAVELKEEDGINCFPPAPYFRPIATRLLHSFL